MKPNNKDTSKIFSVPENYFATFAQEIQTKIAEDKIRTACGNTPPFTVPEDFFKNIDFKLKPKKNYKILKTIFAVAASILLIFAISQTVFIEKQNNKTQTPALATENDNLFKEVENYNSELLISYLSESEDNIENLPVQEDADLEYLADYMALADMY